MLVIPLAVKPNQTMNIMLSGVGYTIDVNQRSGLVYVNISQADERIIESVICRDRVKLIRQKYIPFVGNLVFVDQAGKSDPDYIGFGSRFILYYMEPVE
jgi:hypothetical protein